jgi:hypothetical protein
MSQPLSAAPALTFHNRRPRAAARRRAAEQSWKYVNREPPLGSAAIQAER